MANVVGKEIDLDASADIGELGDDLDIDSGVLGTGLVAGRLFAQAGSDVYLTESARELNILAVRALTGHVRLTVPDTNAADTENLELLTLVGGETARIDEGATATPVTQAEIRAGLTAVLWVGDNVRTAAAGRIVAGGLNGHGITIRGDTRRVLKTDRSTTTTPMRTAARGWSWAAPSVSSTRRPLGTFNPNDKTFTEIFGHDQVDTFTFNQTDLDANTTRLRQPERHAARCLPTTARTSSSSTSSSRCTSPQWRRRHADARRPGRRGQLHRQHDGPLRRRCATTSSTSSTPAPRTTASTPDVHG